jgi:hypothetical protein
MEGDLGRREDIVMDKISHFLKSRTESKPVRFVFEDQDIIWDCYAIHVQGDYFAMLKSNITSQKKLEQELQQSKLNLEETVRRRTKQLEEAVQVKSRFLAIMSHGKEGRNQSWLTVFFFFSSSSCHRTSHSSFRCNGFFKSTKATCGIIQRGTS